MLKTPYNSSRQSQSTTLHADYNYEINRRKPLSFDTIRKYASELYSQKTQIEQNKLHDCLEHGTKILDNMNELYAYLHSYGKMHQAKLNLAFDNIPKAFFQNKEINIVDYGCGQAVGTMCYADYIRKSHHNQKVKSITLIEPSKKCLDRAVLHASLFFPGVKIIPIHKKFEELTSQNFIENQGIPTLHILSNVLDLDFDLEKFAKLLMDSYSGHNQFVCVGPSISNSKDDRIHDFARYFNPNPDNESSGELSEYQLNPDEKWTCVYHCFVYDAKKDDNRQVAVQTRDHHDEVTTITTDSKQVDAEALYCLGMSYCNGLEIEQDLFKAYNWLKKAAEKGNSKAIEMLSYCDDTIEISPGWQRSDTELCNYLEFKKKYNQGNSFVFKETPNGSLYTIIRIVYNGKPRLIRLYVLSSVTSLNRMSVYLAKYGNVKMFYYLDVEEE